MNDDPIVHGLNRDKAHGRVNRLTHHREQQHEEYGSRTAAEHQRQFEGARFQGGSSGRDYRGFAVDDRAESLQLEGEHAHVDMMRALMEETPSDTLGSIEGLDHLY
jgi:hypothetical protein